MKHALLNVLGVLQLICEVKVKSQKKIDMKSSKGVGVGVQNGSKVWKVYNDMTDKFMCHFMYHISSP